MTEWVAYHGKTALHHQVQHDSLSKQGWRIQSLSVYGNKGNREYAAVWVNRPGPAWHAFHGLDSDEFQQRFNEMVAKGFQPTILSGGGWPPVFAGVFEKLSTPFLAKHNISITQLNNIGIEMRDDDMIPRWISVYGEATASKENTLCTAIWVPNKDNVIWEKTFPIIMDSGKKYQERFDIMTGPNHKLRPGFVAITGDQKKGLELEEGPHYCAVWRNDSIGPWVAVHGLTSLAYKLKFVELVGKGFHPIVVQGHAADDEAYYAAIFAKTSWQL